MSMTLRGGREILRLTEPAFAEAIFWSWGIVLRKSVPAWRDCFGFAFPGECFKHVFCRQGLAKSWLLLRFLLRPVAFIQSWYSQATLMSTTLRGGREVPGLPELAFTEAMPWLRVRFSFRLVAFVQSWYSQATLMSTTLRGGREVPGLTESAFAEAI
jgi:hypothetical protein